jgi:hypothetical protein
MVPHFRDEMYGDIKTPGYNVRGRVEQGLNIRGHNVGGRIIPVPTYISNWEKEEM